MDAILAPHERPPLLPAGVQAAIASGESDSRLAIQLELVSILDGPAFRKSERSRSFLRFVVEEALSGRQDSLKERTIGVAVLGKPVAYDTGADPAVRVRANEVRKRLAAHYDVSPPKGAVRIELPAGTYVPRFVTIAATPAAAGPACAVPGPPPMQLWQLVAPTIAALFLVLVAIRADIGSGDAFSRFWAGLLAGRTQLVVVLDAAPDGTSIPAAMAEAALPFAALSTAFQIPVRMAAAGRALDRSRSCLIRLSTTERPPAAARSVRINGATVYRTTGVEPELWLYAADAQMLSAAARSLTSASTLPNFP